MTCNLSQSTNRVGRPREWDRDKILDQLIEWAQKPDSINLNAFCGARLLPPQKLSQWALESNEFRESYWVAKTLIGARRELWLSAEQLHQKAYHLSHHTYDYFTREEDRDHYAYQKEIDAKVGKEINASANEDMKNRLNATLDQLSLLQSIVKNARSNNIKDQ